MIELKPIRLKIVHKPQYLPCVYFQVPLNANLNEVKALEDKELDGYVLTLKKPKNKSLTANAYMWQLCEKIAKKTETTKEDIYRQSIREVGAFTDGVFRSSDVDGVCENWSKNGIGWFAEPNGVFGESIAVRLYQGSSTYDEEQMRRLIDHVVDEAKEQGIDTMSSTEKERLIQLWGEKVT